MDKHALVGNTRKVGRVLWVTFILNESVAAAKIAWGYATGSVGMVSDGFHSVFDGISNIAGLIGVRIASAPPDREHPYGHRKFESLFTGFVGLMILGTCLEVARKAMGSLTGVSEITVNMGSFGVMLVTMAVNLFVIMYESKKGRELGSDFLLADAMHTKSDLFSSTGVLIGLVLVRAGYGKADAIAGLIVAALIARTGLGVIKMSTDTLLDTVRVDTGAVKAIAMGVEGVLDCHHIRSRGSEGCVMLDMHVLLRPDITLCEAHAIGHRVGEAITHAMPEVIDVVVHTEPRARGRK